MTPICTLCPEDTYQDKPGGGECIPCPANYITSSSGATSKDDCVGMFPAPLSCDQLDVT